MLEGVLDTIASLQSGGESHFPPGLFPAYRSNASLGYRRPDTNLFFSVISAFTLQSVSVSDSRLVDKIDRIKRRIVAHYPAFQNKDGLQTYNFWKTQPSGHFANGYLLRHFRHFKIPDDADDTAMVYLTTNPTAEQLLWLKDKLAQHANGTQRWARNTFRDCKSLRAYSTWFGKNMYIELDACVLSNLLYCLYQYKMPFNQYDEDSLLYIRSVIESGRYITEPFRCAHQYPRTALIIYHVARLIAAFEPLLLIRIKPGLIATCRAMLEGELHPMDRLLLSTSLMRLGQKAAPVPVENYSEKDFEGFWFFIAGMLTGVESPWLYRMAGSRWFHMYWECEAHCWVLIAEYLAVRDNMQ